MILQHDGRYLGLSNGGIHTARLRRRRVGVARLGGHRLLRLVLLVEVAQRECHKLAAETSGDAPRSYSVTRSTSLRTCGASSRTSGKAMPKQIGRAAIQASIISVDAGVDSRQQGRHEPRYRRGHDQREQSRRVPARDFPEASRQVAESEVHGHLPRGNQGETRIASSKNAPRSVSVITP